MLIEPTEQGQMNIDHPFKLLRRSTLILQEWLGNRAQTKAYGLFFLIKWIVKQKILEDWCGRQALNDRIHEASITNVWNTLDKASILLLWRVFSFFHYWNFVPGKFPLVSVRVPFKVYFEIVIAINANDFCFRVAT